MMAQADQGLLYANRKAFTNYVLHCFYEKSQPWIEVQLTDADYDTAHGYRYHRCLYNFNTDTVTFKKGMCGAVQ